MRQTCHLPRSDVIFRKENSLVSGTLPHQKLFWNFKVLQSFMISASVHGLCFSKPIVLVQIWVFLFMSPSQAGQCSYGNACRMRVSRPGQQRPGRIAMRARRKMTSKTLKTEHVYFSDSNYSIWKRVNTITLTSELEGFEGLTGHCFPRERQGLGKIQERGLKNQVA